MEKFDIGDFRLFDKWKSYGECVKWMDKNFHKDGKTILREPSAELLEKTMLLVKDIMPRYVPEEDEKKLLGVVLIDAEDYDAVFGDDSMDVYGICCYVDGEAVIALTTLVFERDTPTFAILTLLHELAHLSEEGHGNAFMRRYNRLMYDLLD